jgi:hypothetical protein
MSSTEGGHLFFSFLFFSWFPVPCFPSIHRSTSFNYLLVSTFITSHLLVLLLLFSLLLLLFLTPKVPHRLFVLFTSTSHLLSLVFCSCLFRVFLSCLFGVFLGGFSSRLSRGLLFVSFLILLFPPPALPELH